MDLTNRYLAFAQLAIKKRISSFPWKEKKTWIIISQYFMFWMMLYHLKKIFFTFFNLMCSYCIITSKLIAYGINEHRIRNKSCSNDNNHFNCVTGNTSSMLVFNGCLFTKKVRTAVSSMPHSFLALLPSVQSSHTGNSLASVRSYNSYSS